MTFAPVLYKQADKDKNICEPHLHLESDRDKHYNFLHSQVNSDKNNIYQPNLPSEKSVPILSSQFC